MAIFYSFLIFIIIFFIESSFAGAFRIGALIPNLVLMLLVTFSVYDQGTRPYALSLSAGLLKDLTMSFAFGFHMIFFVIITFLTKSITKENGGLTPMSVLATIFFLASFSYGVVQGVSLYLDGGILNFQFLKVFLFQIALDIALGFLFFFSLRRFFEKLKVLDKMSSQRVVR